MAGRSDARGRSASGGPIDISASSHFLGELRRNGESSRSVLENTQQSRQVGGLPTAADFYVHSLPGVPNLSTHPTHPLNLYSGLLPSYPGEGQGGGEDATGVDAKIFFMMVKARRAAGKQRVVFWFNGGPGCSSFDGSLMEVGPFRVVPASQTESGKVELKMVDAGWEEYSTIVFIDQPPGTGLSYVPTNGYLHELDQGSQHLIKFLQNFYTVFPELSGLDTYLTGESFAGQYIPYFADAIIKTDKLPNFTLTGIAIGNGWIDPIAQYPGYADFAYEKGLIKEGTPSAVALQAELERCTNAMSQYTDAMSTPVNIGACDGLMGAVTAPFVQELNGKKTCMNVYDVRLQDDWPACGMNWPPDLPDVYDFLRRPDVLSALHATEKETAWVECDNRVASELRLRNSPAAVAWLPAILNAGIQVMLFAGAEDLICNYKGIENTIERLDWAEGKGFMNATSKEWFLNDSQVGTWTERDNLTYVKVLVSSHMVGYDVPDVTNDMVARFMGVDFTLLAGSEASSKSRLGNTLRPAIGVIGGVGAGGMPLFKGGSTDWEEWYNAGSAFFILFILLSIVGVYFYFKRRGNLRRAKGLSLPREDRYREERVPLGAMGDVEAAEEYEVDGAGKRYPPSKGRGGKGKGKASEGSSREAVFSLGDDEA